MPDAKTDPKNAAEPKAPKATAKTAEPKAPKATTTTDDTASNTLLLAPGQRINAGPRLIETQLELDEAIHEGVLTEAHLGRFRRLGVVETQEQRTAREDAEQAAIKEAKEKQLRRKSAGPGAPGAGPGGGSNLA